MSRSIHCHGVFMDRFIFRLNFPRMRLLWGCHDQSPETNWRHFVTGPELSFFHKRKGILKMDQSVKTLWHKLSLGVVWPYSLAPDYFFLHARRCTVPWRSGFLPWEEKPRRLWKWAFVRFLYCIFFLKTCACADETPGTQENKHTGTSK